MGFFPPNSWTLWKISRTLLVTLFITVTTLETIFCPFYAMMKLWSIKGKLLIFAQKWHNKLVDPSWGYSFRFFTCLSHDIKNCIFQVIHMYIESYPYPVFTKAEWSMSSSVVLGIWNGKCCLWIHLASRLKWRFW